MPLIPANPRLGRRKQPHQYHHDKAQRQRDNIQQIPRHDRKVEHPLIEPSHRRQRPLIVHQARISSNMRPAPPAHVLVEDAAVVLCFLGVCAAKVGAVVEVLAFLAGAGGGDVGGVALDGSEWDVDDVVAGV
jgi:hypothetical protein